MSIPMQVYPRPQDRRRFARVRPSGLVSKTGVIIVGPKKPGIDCTILDLSAGGACIDVADSSVLPSASSCCMAGPRRAAW